MNKTKKFTFTALITLVFMAGCSNNASYNKVDLDRVLNIMSETLNQIQSNSSDLSESAMMAEFERQFQSDVNHAVPKLHEHTIGVDLKGDASVLGYSDKNNNGIQDSNESELFTVEIDAEGQRLIATEQERVRDHRMGSSFFTGFLIASMLSRQRSAGVSPSSLSAKKVTPKATQPSRKSSSAKSRSKSGSFSRGK